MSFGPPVEPANVGTARSQALDELAAMDGGGPDFGPPDTSHLHGPRGRTRSQIAKGAAAKGANAEREVLTAFRAIMVNVEAEVQAEGHVFVPRSTFAARKRLERGTSNRDLGNIPLISIEIKRREQLAVNDWWAQALRQADKGELPVLVYKANREPWTVVTWLAMTDPTGQIVKYVRGSLALPDFLAYYADLYRRFLMGALA